MITGSALRVPRFDDWWQDLAEELSRSPSPVDRLAAGQGFVLARRQLRELGVPDALVRRRLRSGRWTAPWRGWIGVIPDGEDDGPRARAAAAVLSRPGSAASHSSAAALFGIGLLREPGRVRVTRPDPSQAGGWPGLVVHSARLPATELTSWFGIPVTTPARTVVDIARLEGTPAGLVAADSALHLGHAQPRALRHSCRAARYRPGVRTADRVVALANAGAESPLESLARLALAQAGFDDLTLQAPIATRRGTFFVDLLLCGPRVVIEADGRLKYDRPDALWQEKLRQDAIERAGFRVVRVTWADVTRRPEQLIARIRSAVQRGSSATF